MKKLLITGLTAALLTGCASIERTSPGMMDGLDVVGGDSPAESTVAVRVSGYTLFYTFTVLCGNIAYNETKHDKEGGLLFFKSQVEVSDCYRTLQHYANDQKMKLTNVSLINNTLPSPGLTSYIDLIGFFLESNDAIASGVLRKK